MPIDNTGELSGYRALDLTDEKGHYCGKLLADLGCDVIKIERPGGDAARNIGPFYHDIPHPERSLSWFANNTGKRSATLDIGTKDGQDTLRKLVGSADILIESFNPGYMESLGLGYSQLRQINPGIIVASITPFGQTGPYKDYRGPDIVVNAMSGFMYVHGDADRAPVNFSAPQCFLNASTDAAQGILIALFHRERTGRGQYIDVSAQQSMTWMMAGGVGYAVAWLENEQLLTGREGNVLTYPHGVVQHQLFRCQDGYVCFRLLGGHVGARTNQRIVEWMDAEGMADAFLRSVDWAQWDNLKATQEEIDRIEAAFGGFFTRHTKDELYNGAIERSIMLAPASNVDDLAKSRQLDFRGFWVGVEHPELGETITYPGSSFRSSLFSRGVLGRAPLIGEDNEIVLNQKPRVTSHQEENCQRQGVGQERTDRPVFEGLRVLDFTQGLAGPIAGRLLADYGATVVHVESNSRVDVLRISAPFLHNVPGLNRSLLFGQIEAGKYGILLNMTHPGGQAVAKKLIAWADVVIDSRVAGVMERWGLGYEDIVKIKPDAIVARLTNQGLQGPCAKHPSYGFHVVGLSGCINLLGWQDREPLISGKGGYTDIVAGRLFAVALLAAISYRQRTGRGQLLDVSMIEASINFLIPQVLDYYVNGRKIARMGNRSDYAAPHGAYPCRGDDCWCAIAVCGDDEWARLCRAVGWADWANDPRFATLASRKENERELDERLTLWTSGLSPQEVMTILQGNGVAAGIVKNVPDMCADPQLEHRQHFKLLEHQELGMYHVANFSFKLSETPGEVRRGAPCMGQDNEYAYCSILGFTDEQFIELLGDGVLD